MTTVASGLRRLRVAIAVGPDRLPDEERTVLWKFRVYAQPYDFVAC